MSAPTAPIIRNSARLSSTHHDPNDPRIADLHSFASQFDKMLDSRLDRQRYIPSGDKVEELGKIALGAKVERALARRLVGQDAIFTAAAAQAHGSSVSSERSTVGDEKGL
jgi:hypothetical protein